MMKRFISNVMLIAMIAIAVVVPASAALPGEPIGNVLYSDVVAYIDGYPIRSYNIAGNTYIIVEDLVNYGFSVQWLPNEKKLVISTSRTALPSGYNVTNTPEKNTHPAGTIAMQYLYTEITTWIGNDKVNSYNVGGSTCICMDDLAKYFGTNYVWNPDDISLRLVTISSKSASSTEKPTNTYESYAYSDIQYLKSILKIPSSFELVSVRGTNYVSKLNARPIYVTIIQYYAKNILGARKMDLYVSYHYLDDKTVLHAPDTHYQNLADKYARQSAGAYGANYLKYLDLESEALSYSNEALNFKVNYQLYPIIYKG